MTPAAAWTTVFASTPPPGMLSATTLPTMSANDLCSIAPVIASAAMLAAICYDGPAGKRAQRAGDQRISDALPLGEREARADDGR